MSFFDHIQQLERVHNLIRLKSTGRPIEFANKIGISERTLYRILDELRDRGAIIRFSNERSSYYYENSVEIKIHFQIDGPDSISIKGGIKTCNIYNIEIFTIIIV